MQRMVLVSSLIAALAVLATRGLPSDQANGIAAGILAALLISFSYVYFLIHFVESRRRPLFVLAPLLCILVAVLVAMPNLRRAQLQHRLEALGATVVTTTESGDGDWFYANGCRLPNWVKDYCGDAFFGSICQVRFSQCPLDISELEELHFAEQVGSLNLHCVEIESDELRRITQHVRVSELVIQQVQMDLEALEILAESPCLAVLSLYDTGITHAAAMDFATRHPNIYVYLADSENGGKLVRPPASAWRKPIQLISRDVRTSN